MKAGTLLSRKHFSCKVPSQKENEIQPMELGQCYYITQSKLKHILLGL